MLLCSRRASVWIEHVLSFWPPLPMSTPLSGQHFICAQHSWSCLSCHCEWLVKHLAQRSRFSALLFPLCAKIPAGSESDVLAGEGDSAAGSRGVPTRRPRPTFMTQHAHWRATQTWCRSFINVCVGWVWISDPDCTAAFMRIRTDHYSQKHLVCFCGLTCAGFESCEFCLMFHFPLLPLEVFALDEAPVILTTESSFIIDMWS